MADTDWPEIKLRTPLGLSLLPLPFFFERSSKSRVQNLSLSSYICPEPMSDCSTFARLSVEPHESLCCERNEIAQ
jgi:hypothetical protein